MFLLEFLLLFVYCCFVFLEYLPEDTCEVEIVAAKYPPEPSQSSQSQTAEPSTVLYMANAGGHNFEL